MKKVVVRVGGGQGNQMFEYTLGCALAKRTGRTLCFDLTDLIIFLACRHHIIANSTFSWWGAFQGRDPGGVTVYPDHWFPTLRTGPTMVKEQWVSAPSFVGKRCLPSEQP